ncbi:MAG: hypothetical protein WBA51_05505 [Erythrobacter sp.]
MLLHKDGEIISTIAEHNDKVRKDVAKTIGDKLAELPSPAAAA